MATLPICGPLLILSYALTGRCPAPCTSSLMGRYALPFFLAFTPNLPPCGGHPGWGVIMPYTHCPVLMLRRDGLLLITHLYRSGVGGPRPN